MPTPVLYVEGFLPCDSNATRSDTDRDGVRDDVDRFPLADAFVQVYVGDTSSSRTDEFNDGTPGLEPFAAATYAGERTFTRYVVSSGVIGHFYSFNVPDDASSIQLKVEAWDWDSDNSHDPIKVASSNVTTLTYGTGPYIGWFEWFTFTGTSDPRVTGLRVYVETVTPIRNPVYLVAPQDYSTIYNVTANNVTTSRRYVGEPTFYAVIVNLTDAGYGFNGQKQTWLVPRNVFFDTYLSTRLNAAGNMTGTWLSDSANKVQFSQNSSAGPGTSALDGTLTAELDVSEWATMIDWLKKNASGGVAHTYLRVDWESSVGDYFFLLGLPDPIVQLD